MDITEILPLTKVSKPLVKIIAKAKGWDVTAVETNYEVIQAIIDSLVEKGEHQTVGDLLKDESVMGSIMSYIEAMIPDNSEQIDDDVLLWHRDNIITCPHCGFKTNLKKILYLHSLKDSEDLNSDLQLHLERGKHGDSR